MPFPTEASIHLPLLRVLQDAGGYVQASDPAIYDLVAQFFPEMTEVERRVPVASGGKLRFDNRVQWARNSLRERGDIDGSRPGVWAITAKGRERLDHEWSNWKPSYSQTSRLFLDQPRKRGARRAAAPQIAASGTPVDLDLNANGGEGVRDTPLSLYEQAQREVDETKRMLLDRVMSVTPSGFEKLVGELLRTMGFDDVQVLGRTGDGGIDGECKHKFLDIVVPFQAKRWEGSVGYQPLAEFRGGRAARYERALFVTTSRFTAAARELADEPTRPKLILVDGQTLIDLMVDKQFGVAEQPIRTLVIDDGFLAQFT